MITTVTTVTTISTIAAMGLATAASLATVATLMLLLMMREVTGASQSPLSRLASRLFMVSIVPLVMTFAVIVTVKILELI